MNQEEAIIGLYCCIEECLAQIVAKVGPLRRRGPSPRLSDAELLTIEILGAAQERHSDVSIWRYARDHLRHLFPTLGSYCNFVKQSTHLRWVKEALQEMLFSRADARLFITDGVPLPLCHKVRGNRCKSCRLEADWGYCAAKDEHYYGLKGHIVTTANGLVTHCTITAASQDERSVLHNLRMKIKGMILGDKGYLSKALQDELKTDGINLQTPLRKNMTDTRPKAFLTWMHKTRKRVETTLSILCECFHFNKIKAHNINSYAAKSLRKIIAYNALHTGILKLER